MANWAQLGNLAAQLSGLTAVPGSSQSRYAAGAQDQFAAQIQNQALKKAQEEAEKKKKGALGGKLGSILGTVAGVAAAPFTGGASLAIPAALAAGGSMVGSAAGQAIGGGEVDPMSVLMAGGQGAMGGLSAGMAGPMAAGASAAPTTTAGIPTAFGIPSAADIVTTGAQGIPAAAGAAGQTFSPIAQAAMRAAPSFLGMGGGGGGNISGPPPVQPPMQYAHPSQAMGRTEFGDMRPMEIRRYAAENPGALAEMQQYLNQGGELTPRQQAGMGRPLRTGLQDAGYELASRGGLIKDALSNAFGGGGMRAMGGARGRLTRAPDGSLYYMTDATGGY